MAGGHLKYRHLNRSSAHRQALLRNLVTSLIEHESISTTWPKAKEAQRLAEKVITLAKKNTEASRRRAHEILYTPEKLIPKLFNKLRMRYETRPGGYTRVLHIEPLKEDQAPSAILELVDGPKDMRFAMTARILARESKKQGVDVLADLQVNDLTQKNVDKVTRYRKDGKSKLLQMMKKMKNLEVKDRDGLNEVVERQKREDEAEMRSRFRKKWERPHWTDFD